MRNSRAIKAAIFALIGVALVVRGVIGGVWPLSVQLVVGLAAIAYAIVRFRYS
jgi:hypothetical protein